MHFLSKKNSGKRQKKIFDKLDKKKDFKIRFQSPFEP
jgi:hypothetical protein